MDLSLLCESVRRYNAEPFASGVFELFEDRQEDLHDVRLVLVHIRNAATRRQVNAESENDEIPRVSGNDALDLLLCVFVRGFGLHIHCANSARWRLLEDVLAVAIAVREHQHILRLHLGHVSRWPLASIDAAKRVSHSLQTEVDAVARSILGAERLWHPFDRPARVAGMFFDLLLHELLVLRDHYVRSLRPKHGQRIPGCHRSGPPPGRLPR
mmetsp:Transcript_39593/g.94539  ORF Transcript_39593/g.94539 Transcript_39593/m.94539 type:complete len:212 (-) Transcript_39593:31-666(-)